MNGVVLGWVCKTCYCYVDAYSLKITTVQKSKTKICYCFNLLLYLLELKYISVRIVNISDISYVTNTFHALWISIPYKEKMTLIVKRLTYIKSDEWI